MRDLFRSEFLRFRAWAVGGALLQLIVLGFMTRVVDMAQQPENVYQVIGALYALVGLLLGLYQFGGYRRPNAWLNLLHRPLPHARVALALLAAGALALAIAVWLPLLMIAGWQETMTARVVDARHLWMCTSGLLIALCAYLAGAYVMLAHRRYGYSAVLLLMLLYFSEAVGIGAILIQLMLMVVLLAMVLVAFKPDLSATPNGAGALVTAAPLQFAMWFVLVMVGFGVEFAWIAQGSHPNNRDVPLAGGEKEAEIAEGADLIVMGLRTSAAADAPLWREQARISEVFSTGPFLRRLPRRGELTNVAPMEFDDDTHRVRWVFSHDDMRFHGVSLVDRRDAGTLGVDGTGAFAHPPLPGPDNTLISRSEVFQYDSDETRIIPRVRLPEGERITGVDPAGDTFVVLSNRALYFFDAREMADGDSVLVPRQRVALPGHVGDLQRVDMIELLDGHLVSFLFARTSYNAEGAAPFQIVLRVDEKGGASVAGDRRLVTDYTPAWRFQNWFPSPAWYELQRTVVRLFADDRPGLDTDRPHPPTSIRILALVLMGVSMLAATGLTRGTRMSRIERIVWILGCGLLSLPALMSLWLMHPRREAAEPIIHAHPARA